MGHRSTPLGLTTVVVAATFAGAGPVRGQEALQLVLKDTNVGKHWIYHDFDRARQ